MGDTPFAQSTRNAIYVSTDEQANVSPSAQAAKASNLQSMTGNEDIEASEPDIRVGREEASIGDDEEKPPPLPPRPLLLQSPPIASASASVRPRLQSKATTAVSSVDIQTLSFPDGSRGTFSTPVGRLDLTTASPGHNTPSRKASRNGSEVDEVGSIISYAPTLKANDDLASLLDEGIRGRSPAWKLLNSQAGSVTLFEASEFGENLWINFEHEFDEINAVNDKLGNEEELLQRWQSKYKHYLILSSAGKPIYSRHGDLSLINGYIGIIQTIISFFEDSKSPLMGFTAGKARFVVSIDGPLYFVAISKLGESDTQLRAQLEALYMQILSTLTLPTLNNLFSNRPNTDLRRPLEGTEILLSSLADTFTKGSPSALLSALECLKIRKSHRHLINNTLLKTRTDKLLYGLLVAGGRLVSVVRPKRHSLHPSDLQLIFNMLFEAGSVKAGGGENWIPICLPGFNNRGYLYMYVSFLNARLEDTQQLRNSRGAPEDEITVLLISAEKESFYDLQQMRDEVVDQLDKNGSLKIIKAAVAKGRPDINEIAPGIHFRHFLYKSRANVQLTMSSFAPNFDTLHSRRRLLTLYQNLHASIHAKHSHLKLLHSESRDSVSLAWSTPVFEFYGVAGPNTSRAALAQGANQIIQWVKREEERLFIIGGAVF